MTLLEWLGLSTERFAKIAGVAAMSGTVVLAGTWVRRTTRDERFAALAAALLLLFPGTYFHAVSGLETTAYAFLLTALCLLTHDIVTGRAPARPALAAIPWGGLLLGMTRPEGVLPAAFAWTVALAFADGRDRRWLVRATVPAFLVGLAYMLWRSWYFGHPFPNTFYVKVGDVGAGMEWLASSLAFIAPLLLVGAIRLSGPGRRGTLFVLGFVAGSIATYAVSSPMMDYARRFLFPVLPAAAALAAVALAEVPRRWRPLVPVAGVLLAVWMLSGLERRELPVLGVYGAGLEGAHEALGRALAETDPADPCLAIGDAGAVPYYSEWETVDYIGLNSEEIAHGQDPTRVVAARAPTLLVLYSPDGSFVPDDQHGLRPSALADSYEAIGAVGLRTGYHQVVWLRRDVDAATAEELEVVVRGVGRRTRRRLPEPSLRGFRALLRGRWASIIPFRGVQTPPPSPSDGPPRPAPGLL